jgi:hypothetical protein
MYYQVVARSGERSVRWEYYPYWAPVRERDAAERLAGYAAQSGYEAAILQGMTLKVLKDLAYRVVEQQETEHLPSLRYLPGSRVEQANGRKKRAVETLFRSSSKPDLYAEDNGKAELDERRLKAELGPGGDILARGTIQPHAPLPLRMDVVSAWLRLRERVVCGKVGGIYDGVTANTVDASDR